MIIRALNAYRKSRAVRTKLLIVILQTILVKSIIVNNENTAPIKRAIKSVVKPYPDMGEKK